MARELRTNYHQPICLHGAIHKLDASRGSNIRTKQRNVVANWKAWERNATWFAETGYDEELANRTAFYDA
jgi:hypothetical protein